MRAGAFGAWATSPASIFSIAPRFAPPSTDATPGAGFISIDHLANERKELKVDVCLSVTQTVESGVSVFDDWNRIAKAAKNDLNTEILLRLNLAAAAIRDFDLDGFVAGKRLGTTDLELEVRPSAIQFSPDD